MRNKFAELITELAGVHPETVLLSGDIGNRLFDDFKARHGDRFINCGIAEANMIGVASGLGANGFVPFAYTITPFVTARCYEQIKLDLCYQENPAVIVGTGSGLSYASLGATHHSLDDIGLFSLLPNVRIFAPSDRTELAQLMPLIMGDIHYGATYLRLGKKGEADIPPGIGPIELGKVNVLAQGSVVCLAYSGTIASECIAAAELLEQRGVSVELVSVHSLSPFDSEYFLSATREFELVVTVEEHGITGGLGARVLDLCASAGVRLDNILTVSTDNKFMSVVGTQSYARGYFGLSASDVTAKIIRRLDG